MDNSSSNYIDFCVDQKEISFESLPFDAQIKICEFLTLAEFNRLTRSSKTVYNDLWKSEDCWRMLLRQHLSENPIPEKIKTPQERGDFRDHHTSRLYGERYSTKYREIIYILKPYPNLLRIRFAAMNGFEKLLTREFKKDPGIRNINNILTNEIYSKHPSLIRYANYASVRSINNVFMTAIYYKQSPIIKHIYDKYESFLNYNDGLMAAVYSDNVDYVVEMINRGANDISLAIYNSLRQSNNINCITFFIRKYKNETTPFITTIVKILLSRDLTEWVKGVFRDSQLYPFINVKEILHTACQYGNFEIVNLICQSFSGINYNKSLCIAAKNGHLDIVQLMIKNGATRTVQALYHAAENGHLEVVKFLFPLTEGKGYGKAIRLCQGKHFEVWKYLKNSHHQIKK